MQDKITTTQVTLLIITSIIGIRFLSMPQILAQHAGRDAWMGIILAGFAVLVVNYFMILLGNRFPGKTAAEYSQLILGRFLGMGFNMLIAAFFTILGAFALRTFGDVAKSFLLEKTPLEVILITMLFVVGYILNHGLNALARIAQVTFPLLFSALLILLGLGQSLINYGEVLPFFQGGIKPVLTSAFYGWQGFAGFGLIMFVLPQMFRPKQGLQASSAAIIISAIPYVMIFIAILGVFGVEGSSWLVYPVMDFAREIEFPGAFLERIEIVVLSLWIFTSFTTIAINSYMGIWIFGQSLGLKEYRGLVAVWLPLVYLLSLLPQNYAQVYFLGDILGFFSIGIALIVLSLYFLAKIRGKGEKAK